MITMILFLDYDITGVEIRIPEDGGQDRLNFWNEAGDHLLVDPRSLRNSD
jgi:hypothetical protein